MKPIILGQVLTRDTNYEEQYHLFRHNHHSHQEYYEARAKIAMRKYFRQVGPDTKILDYGCGLGQNMLYLPNAVGYDISKYAVEFCKSKGLQVTSNLDELPNQGFDTVFCAHVLEHHPHPKIMLENIRSKLKTGHDLILVLPYETHAQKGDFQLDLNQHLYCWNFQSINNLLISTGFNVKKNQYLRGSGYFRLLPVNRISFPLYFFTTNLVSYFAGIREMLIVATKA